MFKRVVLTALLSSLAVGVSVTVCHAHGSDYFCANSDGVEGAILPAPTGNPKPLSYTGCHNHGAATYCLISGDEVQFAAQTAGGNVHGSSSSRSASSAAQTSAASSSVAQSSSITNCHFHGATQFCVDGGGNEGYISPAPTNTASAAASYTGCHAHGTEVYCMSGRLEVQFVVEDEDGDAHSHSLASSSPSVTNSVTETSATNSVAPTSRSNSVVAQSSATSVAQSASITNCHFHGATQFCVDGRGSEGYVSPAPTNTASASSSYTGCHAHATDIFCIAGDSEVQFIVEEDDHVESDGNHAHSITAAPAQATAIADCHFHGATQFCVDGEGKEGYISPAPTNTDSAPSSYTSCHAHETDVFCMSGNLEVQFIVEGEESSSGSSGANCHFHAGVEHCVGGAELSRTCERIDRDYNIPLRIGTLFAVLATSAIGVFLPMVFSKLNSVASEWIVGFLAQFGTGVIISTALVHLITHAQLMFGNECLELHYESTATAIVMAGLFVAFLAEFVTTRILIARSKIVGDSDHVSEDDEKKELLGHSHAVNPTDKISVMLLEAGIIFHSVLIGVTLVVAGDSYYITLFIVILFHQAFEGVALGSRINALKESIWIKILMGSAFAVTTPVGMGIGIGVLKHFNGNDPSTVIAIGTLDSFSAGVLLWVGLIEMLANDWIHGPLARAGFVKVGVSLVGLVAGFVLMSFLGKWA